MEGFADAAAYLFTPVPFCLMMLGTALGVMVGAVPGLTGAMLIALTLPLTFSMGYADALILLISMYVGSFSCESKTSAGASGIILLERSQPV